MATITDVAKHAGVSTATVSHVINESRYVSPEVRERVQQAIRELGYERDAIARSLRRNKTGTIGLVIADITNPYFSDIYKGVYQESLAQQEKHLIVISNTGEDPEQERASIEMLRERRVDGLILAPTGGGEALVQDLLQRGLPTVLIDRYFPSCAVDCVVAENREPARQLTDHLIALGHRRIGVMRAKIEVSTIKERMLGFRDAIDQAGIPFDPVLVRESVSDVDMAFETAMALLTESDRPSAVLCTNDFMLLGLLKALTKLDLRCPEDLAVVGFDDFPWAADLRPRLTVAAQPTLEIGRRSLHMLLARMKAGAEQPPQKDVLPTEVIIRESCGATLPRP